MTDKGYRDAALLNYIRAILDVPMDFPEEEILGMYLDKKIGVELIVDDVKGRFERVMQGMLTGKLQ